MTAADIARTLGGVRRSGAWWRCRCPVHGSQGATLALRDGQRGILVHCHAGCSRAEILAALRGRDLIGGAAGARYKPPDPDAEQRRREAEIRDRERRIALARDMIAASLPAERTPAERYLRVRIPGVAAIPPAIRCLPQSDAYARHRSGDRRPVMVAVVEHVEHGVVGAHRTWLAPDGSAKASLAPVRIATGPIRGGAVRLSPPRPRR
jgi:putative DNA primase/helicase